MDKMRADTAYVYLTAFNMLSPENMYKQKIYFQDDFRCKILKNSQRYMILLLPKESTNHYNYGHGIQLRHIRKFSMKYN